MSRVLVASLEGRIAQSDRRLSRGWTDSSVDTACPRTRHDLRSFDLPQGKKVRRQGCVKLHALEAPLAYWPYFLSLRVTAGTWWDSPELEMPMYRLYAETESGNIGLDKGDPSRRSA